MSIQAGIYQHYKGHKYLVLGTARHSETGEIMVVYVPLYTIPANGGTQMAVRPLQMFTEKVEVAARGHVRIKVPRFRYLVDGNDEGLGSSVRITQASPDSLVVYSRELIEKSDAD